MIGSISSTGMGVAPGPVDGRKGLDGFAILVRNAGLVLFLDGDLGLALIC